MDTVVQGAKPSKPKNCAYINADLRTGYKGGIYAQNKDGTLYGPNRKVVTITNTETWSGWNYGY